MESYASRIRRLGIFFIIYVGIISVGHAQETELKSSKRYGHVNLGFALNSSKVFTDSINDLTYDFGVGANLEYEMFFSDKLSGFWGLGLSYLKTSKEKKSTMLSVLATDARIGGKYSFNGRVSVIAGPTLLYVITSRVKTSYIDKTWSNVNYSEEYHFGGFAGFEFYVNDWSMLRSLAIFRTGSTSFEISYVITPKLIRAK